MITYPVDTATRWAIWSVAQADIIKHNKPWPRADGGEIVGLDPDLVPLLEVEGAQPAFDPLTHRLIRSAPVIDVRLPGQGLPHGVQDIPCSSVFEQIPRGSGTHGDNRVCGFV